MKILTHNEIEKLFEKCKVSDKDYISLKLLFMACMETFWLECEKDFCKLAINEKGRIVFNKSDEVNFETKKVKLMKEVSKKKK